MQSGINPWSNGQVIERERLFSEFGIEPIEPIVQRMKNPPSFFRRGIVIGHRQYGPILDAIEQHTPFHVLSGFMPSGHPHLGHLMVMKEMVWHVQQGGRGYMAIADREAHAVRNLSWEKCREYAREYLTCLYALGYEGTHYSQSTNERVKDLAFEAAIKVNFADLNAIYGFAQETALGHAMSVITQVADILFPQLDAGPAPTIVPVGIDQDPHIRLTRDVAYKLRMFTVEQREGYVSVRSKNAPPEALKEIGERFAGSKRYEGHVDIPGASFDLVDEVARGIERVHGGYGFYLPSSTYHVFMPGLGGGKMSSSIPGSSFGFHEPESEIRKKISNALTGGRSTLEEQKRLGGEPEKCTIYLLNLFHLVDDDEELATICRSCREGSLMCGTCKKETFERVREFLAEFREKMDSVAHMAVE